LTDDFRRADEAAAASQSQAVLDSFVKLMLISSAEGKDPTAILNSLDPQIRDEVWGRFQSIPISVTETTDSIDRSPKRPLCDHTSSDGFLWRQLRDFLMISRGRKPAEVDSLDEASDEVLKHLGDPNDSRDGLSKIKGLVIGYVQSGKTANYTALIAKAFDAGYKIVIVLAGIHNSLRRQTQLRLEDELGLIPTSETRITASLSGSTGEHAITAVTSADLRGGDFQQISMSKNVLENGRFLFVVKKNATVLKRLVTWLGKEVQQSVLIIDDEADQASPNTGGNRDGEQFFESDEELTSEELSPTEINKQIRKLVKLCRNVSYVGYTATPFANVFIDQNAFDFEAGDDLFPEDFIVPLPKPENYLGPSEFFGPASGGDADGQIGAPLSASVIVEVAEGDRLAIGRVGSASGTAQVESDLVLSAPESLKEAIEDFVIATSIRRSIEGRNSASAMLVHTSPSQQEQRALHRLIQTIWNSIRSQYKYNEPSARVRWSEAHLRFVSRLQDSRFGINFDEYRQQLEYLLKSANSARVLLLNHGSEDELDYELDRDLTAIVVGGNKLSRGLTIEGLIVSYFVRNSRQPKADTLAQMGRFFGYKKNFAELNRIYTTREIVESFREISELEDALRLEAAYYARTGKEPRDFAPRVLRRASLMPTAKNKMKAALAVGVSYSGDLVQSTSFPTLDQLASKTGFSKIASNARLVSDFVLELGIDGSHGSTTRFLWRDVAASRVKDFLGSFEFPSGVTRMDPDLLIRYIEECENGGELTSWNIGLISRNYSPLLGFHQLDGGFKIPRVGRALDYGSQNNIGALVNPLNTSQLKGDELIDMTETDLMSISKSSLRRSRPPSTTDVRLQRDPSKGLLLLYPISPESIGSSPGKETRWTLGEGLQNGSSEPCPTIFGVAMVFPFSRLGKPIQYWQAPRKKVV
jgi:Z1 domain